MSKSKNKPKALTKAQMVCALSDKTGLTKTQIQDVISAQAEIVNEELKKNRPVVLFGLVKVSVQTKAATSARPGRNPFTGESITIKAKPERRVVKVRALKGLKDRLH